MAQNPEVEVGGVASIFLILEKGKMETLNGWVACPKSEPVVGLIFGYPIWIDSVSGEMKWCDSKQQGQKETLRYWDSVSNDSAERSMAEEYKPQKGQTGEQ